MKRPARIRVLGKPFTISYVPAGDPRLPETERGNSEWNKQAIVIEDNMPHEMEQDTALHEVLHMVEQSMDLDLEETAITRLASGLLAVIKENPSFVRYLATKSHVEIPKA